MCASTPMLSPSRPIAVIAFPSRPTPVNAGLARTDISTGADVQLSISTLVTAGLDVQNSARPCAASLSRQFETGILPDVISTMPAVAVLLPNLRRQRESEPVDPALKTIRPQFPALGAVIEPLLLVSLGWP